MRTAPPRLLPIFRSEPQLRMLARLVLHPDSWLTAKELAAASGMSQASLHRELIRTLDAGLVERDATRQPHQYRASPSNPALEPLAALLRQAVGIEEDLRALLEDVEAVDAAVLYGSWAEGTAGPRSDIDLLVVGDRPASRPLRSRLRRLGEQTGRHIDLLLVSPLEFATLRDEGNPLIRRLLESPTIPLVGELPE